MNKLILFVFVLLFWSGCGQNPEKINEDFLNNPLPIINNHQSNTNNILIHGMSGPYPESIKGKMLGKGLFNFEYKKIEESINNQLKEVNAQIKISFISTSKSEYSDLIIRGLKNYFQSINNYLINFDGFPDVKVVIINDNNLVTFKILFNNRVLFNPTPPIFLKLPHSINWYILQAKGDWSEISIKNNLGKIVKFKVMAKPVLLSDYYPNKLTKYPEAVTYVSFDEADDYCYKHYKGSVVSLYVFEYVLRNGLIYSASKYGANKEFVAGFDPANEEDLMFRRPGDVVYLKSEKCEKLQGIEKDECYSNKDASKQLIFNYNSYKYEEVDFNYKGKDTTFRCMIKEN